jgi:hypothetical protein
LRELNEWLKARGASLIIAGRRTEVLVWLRKIGLYRAEHEDLIFPTLRQALKAFQQKERLAETSSDDE